MIDLQPTGLAFEQLKIWFLLGYKSSHSCEPYKLLGKVCIVTRVLSLLGASALSSV